MKMKKTILLILSLSILTPCISQEKKPIKEINKFEENITKITFSDEGVIQTQNKTPLSERMEHYKIPGISIALVRDNKIEWKKAYGVLVAGKDTPVDNQSLFQAGSVSKFVTAMIVMHYVGEGVLDLDKDINVYLKSWKMPENKFGTSITLRHLLSHQSGLPGTNFARDKNQKLPDLPQILSAESPAQNKPALPDFKPGEKWSYSNIGYVVIQLVLEDVLEKSLDEIAKDVLYEPLGMKSTTFNYPLPKSWQKREAMPHATDGTPKLAVQDTRARAQGGLLTTPGDMALLSIELMKAYQGLSNKVISKSTAIQMLTPQADIPIEAFGIPFKMGLGVFLDVSGDEILFLHPGQSYPGSAFLIFGFPESGEAVTMGLNGNKGDQLELEILATFSEMYHWAGGQFFKK